MIFLTGPHNSGKSTIARQLRDKGFLHVETGDVIRKIHQELAPETNLKDWAVQHQNHFDDFILEEVIQARSINESNGNGIDVIVTGNRQMAGIRYLQERVPPLPRKKHLVLYLEAPEPELYKRQIGRLDRQIPGLTYDAFVRDYLAFDIEMGLHQIKESADFIIPTNTSPEEVLHAVELVLNYCGYDLRMNAEGGRNPHTEAIFRVRREAEI
jgi:adenylate kinase family enzyme